MLTGPDVVLATANGTIQVARNPASAIVTYRRNDETDSHDVRGDQIELPAGLYVFSASAPGFTESTTRVQLAGGESREVGFTLARERPTPPPVVANGMAEFEDAQNWTKDGGTWVHKSRGFVPYKLPPKGVFTFTVELPERSLRAGQIRWCLQYLGSKNYLLYEFDRKNFWVGEVKNGKRLERGEAPHNLGNQKSITIQIVVTPCEPPPDPPPGSVRRNPLCGNPSRTARMQRCSKTTFADILRGSLLSWPGRRAGP